MKSKLTQLINVKSIVTILLSIVFCYLSVKGKIMPEQYITIFTTIIAFYFGTQKQKNDTEGKK